MGCEYVSRVDKDSYWEVKKEEVKECSLSKPITISMSLILKLKIDALMEKYKSREWLAYLLGSKRDNSIYDLFFPEQIATTTHVTPVEFPQDKRIIGVIHSHHNMGHNFSHTDDEFINSNHHLSIVVSNSGYSGTIRSQTPCGKDIKVGVKIEVNYSDLFNREQFLSDTGKKMKEVEIKNVEACTGKISNRRSYRDFFVDLDEEELEELIKREVEMI